MAYNPFNIFRRNQKALFAVLTVFVMIVFTLSSGVRGGDFFETVSHWLGGRSGTAVCKIDGHTVSTRELKGPRGLHFRRVMANRFMYHAALQTLFSLMDQATKQRERLSEGGKMMADAARRTFEAQRQLEDPQFRNSPFASFMAPQLLQQIQRGEQLVAVTLESPTAKSEDKEVARMYQTIFNLRRQLEGAQGEQYFTNAPNKTDADLIDFMLWEKKADQLGIRFTKDDVKQLIKREFYNSFTSDVEVRKLLQQTPGFTLEGCMDAIGDEFKVRAAQTAVLGYAARYHRAPAYPTPYETFEYYRDQCSPTTYEVIAVPAAGFVDKVVGEPTDAEINELFKKYADAEPNPKSETPGFKEPRKIAISYLGITGEEPYYMKLAEEEVKVGEVMAQASGMLTVPMPGATASWGIAAVAPLTIKQPAIDAAYNQYVSTFDIERNIRYRDPNPTTRDLLTSSIVKPGVLAATLGGFVGQTAGFGNPAAAACISMGAPIAYEIRDRVKVGVPLVLAWSPSPALLPTLVTGAATSTANEPKPLPIEYMRPELLKNTIAARAKVIAFGDETPTNRFQPPPSVKEKGDLAQFTEELQKMTEDGKPKDKAAVEKYIKEFIAKRGLTHFGASTALHDEWTLEDDPGLKPLVDAHKLSLILAKGAHGGVDPYSPFGRAFFWTSRFDPGSGGLRQVPSADLYHPEPYPPQEKSSLGSVHYVYWRTEDISPKKTNLFTARPAVIAAWKRLKARELALAQANRIAEQIRAVSSSDPLVFEPVLRQIHFELQLGIKDAKAADRAKQFAIPDVAPLVPSPMGAMGGMGTGQLQPFQLRESDNIPYPTPEMRAALLDNRDKPPKTVLVLPDAPKDTFYVATLIKRDLKTPDEFKINVYSRLGNANSILPRYYEDSANKSQQTVMDLLKKEFRYEVTDEQKKKLEENVKSGGASE